MKKLMVFVAALAMITSSAYAADWNFYGNARVGTFITDVDNPVGVSDTKNWDQSLYGTSRIGANVTVSDELTAQFEYGATPNLRLLYGTWNFGTGTFTVGQFWTPVNWYMSNQAYGDAGLGGWGSLNSGRQAGLQLGFGGFKVALLAPYTDADVGWFSGLVGYTTEVDLPRIEADYIYNFGNGFVKVLGGYQTYEVKDAGFASGAADVDSYVLGLNGGMTFGAFSLKGGIFMGENLGAFSSWGSPLMANTTTADSGVPSITAAGTVTDADAMGYMVVASFKASDMFSLEAGYGYAENDYGTGASDDEVSSAYLQSTVTLAPGVFFVPEVGYIDYDEDPLGATEPETLYYGVKWQINF
jgi:hypothetical protein